jgi:hypothetical protein
MTEPFDLKSMKVKVMRFQIVNNDSIIEFFWKVYNALVEYNYTPEELLKYERYSMKEDEINPRISDAKAEGAVSKTKEMTKNLLLAGVDVKTIAKASGLFIDEINALM